MQFPSPTQFPVFSKHTLPCNKNITEIANIYLLPCQADATYTSHLELKRFANQFQDEFIHSFICQICAVNFPQNRNKNKKNIYIQIKWCAKMLPKTHSPNRLYLWAAWQSISALPHGISWILMNFDLNIFNLPTFFGSGNLSCMTTEEILF